MSDEMPSFEDLKEMTDHEILIMVVQKLREFGICQCKHLVYHKELSKRYWKVIAVCSTIALTGIVNLGIALLVILLK